MPTDEPDKLLPFNKFICHAQVSSIPFSFVHLRDDGQEGEGLQFDIDVHYKWDWSSSYKSSARLILPVQIFRHQTIEFVKSHVEVGRYILIGDSVLSLLRPHKGMPVEGQLGLILDERKGDLMLLPRAARIKKS